MRMARYTCMDCNKEFDAPWSDEAFVLAIECIWCKGTALGSRNFMFEDGCMTVKNVEKKVSGV